ncbi:phosphoglycerate dehydrogenase [Lentilactobacillus otakiensis]|jgi:D-3-phosphoglycerate dehydrogenase|uniref:D-3-phosphoglycerate dehydrogenase n=1 Tax=Lentilactobacillus otakiensis DSM 19908 = JCM 15040 TaxID=1423780 RepID=S4PPI0_9LACO|nr:phosphoglycerate dehydrogenase [Lentilactobacillus otakiensis]KRL10113.1 glyoxylate reductase [Lentilactobacillus otakiensis DSM 19908 = JCM 15040]MBZ3776370.1 phosphoglycerate dehydrogenase [Lentilactobacillus otakiensis]MDV3517965.1 phosphoglycerate dehydrogenase [Lentilactobacillus otakiensis]GAD16475.1 D-3-phosphoglycerate dehydrogenase [Lentilactobacillus otakiensis DSM 19908 = JCM 15040]
MTDKVLVPAQLHPDGKRYLRDHGFDVVELLRANAENILKNGKDAAGMILFVDPIGEPVISQMPNLKIIARHGVGYDSVDLDASARHGVWVTTTPNANAVTVAETTLAEIMDVSKKLTKDSIEMRSGNFGYSLSHLGFELEGKTLGILGYGRIGRLVAKKASGLGMQILIHNRTPKESPYGEFVDLDTLMEKSDVLTLHLAANPQTRHIIGRKQLSEMKRSSVLINLGRGALVNTDALIDALKSGSIAGAALDVFDEEPLPMDSELFKLDNVLLTPHIGSSTVESFSRMATDAASEVVRVLNGEQPQWPVNQPK